MAPTFFSTGTALLALTASTLLSTVVASSHHNHAYLHNGRRHVHEHEARHTVGKRAPAPVTGWEDFGCYSDSVQSRTLFGANTASNSMTPTTCINWCAGQGYPLAGVEYAQECFCGKSFSIAATKINQTYCNFQCSGDNTLMCGGNAAINVYHNTADKAPTSPPVINAGVNGFGYAGCYVDSVQKRSLPNGVGVPAGGMSIAKCTLACSNAGYSWAGTEYAGECYCGNTLPDSLLAPDGEAQCNMGCSGNSSEICGGSNRLNVYHKGARSKIAPLWPSIGCYTDSVQARTFSVAVEVPGGYLNMTGGACTRACQAAGYTLAGTEYGQECWCGNSFLNGGAPASDGCNMACKGDPSSFCGGSNRMNVYKFDNASTPISSTTTTGTTTGTATATGIATTTASASPTPSFAGFGNFTYAGCYIDNTGGRRILPQFPDNATVDGCIAFCNSNGYTVAGMEYYTQCFCGKALQNGAVKASDDSQCNTACQGNTTQFCGGPDRMSIYTSSKNLTVIPVPTVKTTGLPAGWTYQGCLAERQAAARVFPWFRANDDTTSLSCIQRCDKYGFTAAAIEYTDECMCGDDTDRVNAGVQYLDPGVCSFPCAADPATICGGPLAMSYYTKSSGPVWGQATGDAAGQYSYLIGGLVIPLITQIGRNGKVVLTEKHGTGPPNSTGAYELDVSLVSQGMGAAWREMYGLQTDVFCSAGFMLPDRLGRVLNIGGWSVESLKGVRLYTPDGQQGTPSVNDWQENWQEVALQAGRWYPGAMMMANGSMFILGGEDGSNGPPVPNGEIVPKPAGGYLKFFQWMQDADPYNLYPFMVVLPSGGIGVFYYNEARVLDEVTLDTKYMLPTIPCNPMDPNSGRTYPLEGTAMILPQKAPYTDPLQVVLCGGSTVGSGQTLDSCVTITPEDPNAQWQIERMPDHRVMTSMTALPDGTYMILNGAHLGEAGFGLGQNPGMMAMLYDPSKPFNQRFTRMANTTIARMYHSEAILLMDGRILVTGSDPNPDIQDINARPYPQEYRVEVFTPPYLMGDRANNRPAFNLSTDDWDYGKSYPITITKGDVGSVALMAAVASTHGNSMGQRTIMPAYTCSGTRCYITAPPNAHVAGGPAWHMLFVLNSAGTPSQAQWVRIGGDPAKLGAWPNFPDFDLPGLGPTPLGALYNGSQPLNATSNLNSTSSLNSTTTSSNVNSFSSTLAAAQSSTSAAAVTQSNAGAMGGNALGGGSVSTTQAAQASTTGN